MVQRHSHSTHTRLSSSYPSSSTNPKALDPTGASCKPNLQPQTLSTTHTHPYRVLLTGLVYTPTGIIFARVRNPLSATPRVLTVTSLRPALKKLKEEDLPHSAGSYPCNGIALNNATTWPYNHPLPPPNQVKQRLLPDFG